MAGILVITYFVMGYFGYEVNSEYFAYSKKACEERLKDCTNNLIREGLNNVKCDFICVDPQLIIKKK
jgi:hypothetical protein